MVTLETEGFLRNSSGVGGVGHYAQNYGGLEFHFLVALRRQLVRGLGFHANLTAGLASVRFKKIGEAYVSENQEAVIIELAPQAF